MNKLQYVDAAALSPCFVYDIYYTAFLSPHHNACKND